MWIKMDPLDYACMKIRRFENRFGLELGIDWVEYAPHSILNDYGGYYLDNITGERTIFIPRTRDKEVFDEILYHEMGHAYYERFVTKNWISTWFVWWEVVLSRFLFLIRYKTKDEISLYSQKNAEENFCEYFAILLCNYNRKRWFLFEGEKIDTFSSLRINKKLEMLKNLLEKK